VYKARNRASGWVFPGSHGSWVMVISGSSEAKAKEYKQSEG